jgi:anti-anti-sigma factor
MFRWDEAPDRIECRMSSSLHLIERAVEQCREFLDPSEGDVDVLVQILREILLNAVEHGNRSDPDCEVSLVLKRTDKGRFHAIVRDQGEGFCLTEESDPRMPGSQSTRRRGLAIAHALCDELVSAAEEGCVNAWITLPQRVLVTGVLEDSLWVVTPGGDLSASVAGDFRKALLHWLEAEPCDGVLDLSKVRTMDSICLSVLLAFHRELELNTGERRFRLIKVQPRMMALFRMTRIDRLFTIEEDESNHVR